MNNLSFGGLDASRHRPFAYYETIAGGMGAGPEHDGQSATHTHMTNSWNTPVEALEHQLPVRIREYSIRNGSGGYGARRGGNGIVRELEFLDLRQGHVTVGPSRARTLRAQRWRIRLSWPEYFDSRPKGHLRPSED